MYRHKIKDKEIESKFDSLKIDVVVAQLNVLIKYSRQKFYFINLVY